MVKNERKWKETDMNLGESLFNARKKSGMSQEAVAEKYAERLEELLRKLKQDYGYNELDSFLVLKDILAGIWTIKQ